MSNSSEKYINGVILQNGGAPNMNTNTPLQYADKQTQYMAKRSRQFATTQAKWSSDYVSARVQGIDKNNFYKYFGTNVRLSDMHTSPTVSQQTDDTKQVLFDEPKIDYFPIGAKIETMGSTWICTNPSNLSSTLTTAVIRRCNVSYNLYDYYGNIITEPIILDKVTMLGNNNTTPQNLVMMDGYFNVICQLNDNTKQLGLNQRIILGDKAYFITGFTNFIQEFSGDYDSTHILYFTVRQEEPTQLDDVPNRIANGLEQKFESKIIGSKELKIGENIDLQALFIKNADIIDSTEEKPIDWKWQSSDDSVLTINNNGQAVGMSVGIAQITAVMAQNNAIKAVVELVVKDNIKEPYIAFNGVIPDKIEQYDTAVLSATYYENGVPTNKNIQWSFSGANKRSYIATINGNTVEIYGVLSDNDALIVTASYEDKTISTNIALLGY